MRPPPMAPAVSILSARACSTIRRKRLSSLSEGLPTWTTFLPSMRSMRPVTARMVCSSSRSVTIWVSSSLASSCSTSPSARTLPAVEDRDAVADVLHVGQQVAGQQDRLAAAAELDDEVLDLAAADGVQAGGRLVEDEQVGVVDEGLGQADAAGHALGILADGAARARGQADHLQEHLDALAALAAGDLEEPAVVVERLVGVQEAVEVGLLGQEADAVLDLDVAGRLAEDPDAALAGVEQAEHHLDGRGLARAVGAQQAEDLALLDGQAQVADGGDALAHPEVAEDLGQADQFDRDCVTLRNHVLHCPPPRPDGARPRRGS